MQYRRLGRTGVEVSRLCFGTMSFGGDADAATSSDLFAAARNAGINFFDCADQYNGGRAEEILGQLMSGSRDDLVITTKVFNPARADRNARGTNRRHVARQVEASLKRLGTDRIDVLFVHQWDPSLPLEETLRGLEDLSRSGKVLYLGASNYAAWQIATALGISARKGWQRFDVIQPMYSLVKRQAEVEILPLAEAEQLGVITYSPVGGGLLSGKYVAGAANAGRPNAGRLIENERYSRRYGEAWVHDTAAAFAALAQAEGVHPVALAVAWAAHHPAITAPIIGARSLEQLRPSLGALDVKMTDDLHRRIAALSRTPPPATDRLEETA